MQTIQEQVAKVGEAVKEQIGLGEKSLDFEKLKEMQQCIKNDPIKSKLKYHVTSSIGNSFKVTNKISRFELGHDSYSHSFNIIADMPTQLGGNDSGASPEELLLSALGSCLCMSFLCLSKCENINITKCSVKLRGKIDLRSTFEEHGSIQRGFRAVIAKFDVQGENLERERLRELIRRAELLSPIAQTIQKTNKLFVCLKGEGKDIEQRYGLIGKEEVGGVSEKKKVEGETLPGFEILEGVRFLQPGVSVSPRRDISSPSREPQSPLQREAGVEKEPASPAQKPTLAQEQKPLEKKIGEVEKRTGTESVAPETKTR